MPNRNFHTSQVLMDCERLRFLQSFSITPMSLGCEPVTSASTSFS